MQAVVKLAVTIVVVLALSLVALVVINLLTSEEEETGETAVALVRT